MLINCLRKHNNIQVFICVPDYIPENTTAQDVQNTTPFEQQDSVPTSMTAVPGCLTLTAHSQHEQTLTSISQKKAL